MWIYLLYSMFLHADLKALWVGNISFCVSISEHVFSFCYEYILKWFITNSWEGRDKSTSRQLLAVGSALHLVGNVVFTTFLLTISANNYPGGVAVQKLHQIVPQDVNVSVHIDNFSAQTGVSRFTQLHDHWRFVQLVVVLLDALDTLQPFRIT